MSWHMTAVETQQVDLPQPVTFIFVCRFDDGPNLHYFRFSFRKRADSPKSLWGTKGFAGATLRAWGKRGDSLLILAEM